MYGLDKEWLLEHPEAAYWTRREQYKAVQRYGGCVVQAHPFRQHDYIQEIHLSSGCVHGIEVANAGNHEQSYDALAMKYAKRLGISVTAGSDIHEAAQLHTGMVFGVYLDRKMKTIQDYVTAPVDIRDAKDRSTHQDIWDFLVD